MFIYYSHNKNLFIAPPEWSPWDSWEICSRSCGGGIRERSRRCMRGTDCPGNNDKELQTCNNQLCPSTYLLYFGIFVVSINCFIKKKTKTKTYNAVLMLISVQ